MGTDPGRHLKEKHLSRHKSQLWYHNNLKLRGELVVT